MMARCHLRCKKSLLLLERKFLLRVGDKKSVFLIEFTFLFYFIFIYSHCYISISSLYGVTLWKMIFFIFGSVSNPGSYICMYFIFHMDSALRSIPSLRVNSFC